MQLQSYVNNKAVIMTGVIF